MKTPAFRRTSGRGWGTGQRLVRLSAALLLVMLVGLHTQSAHAQDWARQRLDASPRHREFVSVQSGSRTVQTYVVYPEVSGKAPVVVLIHEIFGLSDWAREMADELAAQGYIVVAPDLLSGMGPNGGGSSSFPPSPGPGGQMGHMDTDATVKAVSSLNPAQVTADLNAVSDYGKKIPSSNGKLAVVGFCWGGGKAFAFASERTDLRAAFVFYGPPPETEAMGAIHTPVFGFYAGNDARIGATVPGTVEAMKKAGKTYEPVTYDGAGHGFMRAGEAPDASPENKKAREEGFARLKAELARLR